jgi:hypothetical protein
VGDLFIGAANEVEEIVGVAAIAVVDAQGTEAHLKREVGVERGLRDQAQPEPTLQPV